MMKNIFTSGALIGALIVGSASMMSSGAVAGGNEAYTYEATFQTRKAVALRSGKSKNAGVRRQLAKGSKGIVLRYCAPELSTGSWYFAGTKGRLKLLATTTCEVGYNGSVGFLDGKDLAFD